MKLSFLFIITIAFSGCELLETQNDKNQKIIHERIEFEKQVALSKEIQLKKLSAQTQKELAILESKKELANIEKAKELEKIRIQAELEKQKILFEQEKVKNKFEYKMKEYERRDNMELKRYLVLMIILLIILSSYFAYYYLKKRREDKLTAYNDNLQKYFHHKENEARVKIAEKMLDTIASGKLDKAQENQLINAFSGESKGEYQKQLTQNTQEDVQDVEIVGIEHK